MNITAPAAREGKPSSTPVCSRRRRSGNRLARTIVIVLAAAGAIFGLVAPASAQILYSAGGGYINPIAACNARDHTFQLRTSIVKDPRVAWQNVQLMWRFQDVASGAYSYGALSTYTVVDTWRAVNLPTVNVGATRMRISYAVRFGTSSGYPAWSAWTPAWTQEYWPAYGYLWDTTAICYT